MLEMDADQRWLCWQDIVVSACHIRDAHAGHACAGNADCGVDGASCRRRTCSEHGVCHVLEQAS